MTREGVAVGEDALSIELAEIREQQRALATRAGEILRLLSFPYVDPVLVFNRHGLRHDEEFYASTWDGDPPVAVAFNQLRTWQEEDYCSPIGVSVGGSMISYEDLFQRFVATAAADR